MRHAVFCVRRLRGGRGSTPCFPAQFSFIVFFYCIGFTSDPLIIQLFTNSRNGLRRGKSPAPPTPRSLRDRTVQ